MSELSEEKVLHFEGADEFENAVLRYTYNSRQEAYEGKRERMQYNRINYDTFNLRQDFTHKKKGQSKEFLPKQRMAIQQLASFLSQSIVSIGKWFSVEAKEGMQDLPIRPHEIYKLLEFQLSRIGDGGQLGDGSGLLSFLDDSFKLAALGSVVTCKVGGKWVDSYSYEAEKSIDEQGRLTSSLYRNSKKVWKPNVSFVRQEDYFPDPTGQKLFFIHQMEIDLHRIRAMAEGPNAIYDIDVVNKIVGGFEDMEQEARKARETGQLMTFHTSRRRCRVWECYGNILDPATGAVIMENAMWTVVNDRFLVQKPVPNPFWHGQVPEVTAGLIRVPHSVWHTALADAPTSLNLAMNELFNLQVDTGMMATWGIRQLRPNWLADDTKYADGIPPGETIEVNEACPPGMHALEPVQTSVLTPESMQVYTQISAEFNQAAMTNDLRMGNIPNRDIRATEVVEANQTIQSMIGGIAKMIEEEYLLKILQLLWMTCAQHIKDMDEDELVSIWGQDRTNQILAMGSEEIFASTVKGVRYKVFGLSESLSKMKDFRKLTALLQTASSNPMLMEQFTSRYDFGKFMEKIVRSLDIDPADIEHPPEEIAAMKAAMAGGGQAAGGPNTQSQIPQVASGANAQTGNGIAQPAALQNSQQYANAAQIVGGTGGARAGGYEF